MKHAVAFLLSASIAWLSAFAAHPAPVDAGTLHFDAAIDADIERSAVIHHHYEFDDIHDSPPPSGYKPVYISHYGRHGSRYQISEKNIRACAIMEDADKAGVLTPSGRELLRRLRALSAVHQGMFECLSIRGAEEHKRLAQRMYGRFPEVFSGSGKVRCQSTTRHRCLTSMASFSCSLKGSAPRLSFEFMTGEGVMKRLSAPIRRSAEARKEFTKMEDRLLADTVDPSRLMRLLFSGSPEAGRIAGSPHRFALALFDAASACQSLERELDGLNMYEFFTMDELKALARFKNGGYYASMGNSAEFGADVVRAAKPLAMDVAERADEALMGGGVRADLRFGHDSTLLPFAGLLGIEGAGDRVPAAESWRTCPIWKFMPMASNIQLVFYRSEGGPVLVKVLYNERESRVRELKPCCGIYYDWREFREWLLKLAAG